MAKNIALPGEQTTIDEFIENRKIIATIENLELLINHLPYITLILNKYRQIVYANQKMIDFLGLINLHDALGMRPGEIMQCIHSHECSLGCGSAAACKYCGCLQTVLSSLSENKPITGDCRITAMRDGHEIPLELKITSAPVKIKDTPFVIVSLLDISNEKQKERLERVFCHDLINTIGGMSGLLDIVETDDKNAQSVDIISLLKKSAQRLLDELQFYREINNAELGSLETHPEEINAAEFLEEMCSFMSAYPVISARRKLKIIPSESTVIFKSDKALVSRIIINMVKNALEASPDGHDVTIGYSTDEKTITFRVHNDGAMSPAAKNQVFQRSFSTKGKGRGIGTYSMKLFTEQYLNGKTGFTSNESDGTEFYAKFPIK